MQALGGEPKAGLSAESTLLLTVTPEAGSEVGELGLGTLSVATHESQGGRGESHSPCHEHTAPVDGVWTAKPSHTARGRGDQETRFPRTCVTSHRPR